MKKTYQQVQIEVISLNETDVITSSGFETNGTYTEIDFGKDIFGTGSSF